eukprot:4604939-Pyramimonas_sp.AAC.1
MPVFVRVAGGARTQGPLSSGASLRSTGLIIISFFRYRVTELRGEHAPVTCDEDRAVSSNHVSALASHLSETFDRVHHKSQSVGTPNHASVRRDTHDAS